MIDALATTPDIDAAAVEPPADWRADLRFFLTCYACGLAAFLVMLS